MEETIMAKPWEEYATNTEGKPWEEYSTGATAAPERTVLQDLGRQAGLTARIGIEGAADLAGLVADPLSAVGNKVGQLAHKAGLSDPLTKDGQPYQFQPLGQATSNLLDNLGLPKPENSLERVVNATGRTMLPAGATIKGAQMVGKTASPAAQKIANFLKAAPAQQMVGAAGAGLGSSAAKEMGASPGVQLAAGVATGLGAAAGASTVGKAFNTGSLIAQPTDVLGSVRQKNAREAIDTGYVLPPSVTESGVVSRTLEGLSGKDKMLQLASVKNQAVTDNLAKDYLKIPRETDLTAETLNSAKIPYNEVYQEVSSLPAIKRALGKESLSGKEALDQLKSARYDSKLQWNHFNRSGDPEALAKATALDKTAAKLEQQLEGIAMSAKKPELVQQLRDARKELAKIYTVEKSINPETGNVDAKAIAKLKEKGVPLDGALGQVAKTATAFPDATRVPKAGYANPLTAWDMTFGGLGYAVSPYAVAMPAGRVAARYGVLSKAGQKAINAKSQTVNPGAAIYGLGSVKDSDD
jgi:hypothetical protein